MGIDYSSYIGGYVRCKTHKVNDTESRRSCSNSKCKSHGGNVWDEKKKFCEACGSEITKQDFPIVRQNVERYELYEELKEQLMPPFGDTFHFKMDEQNEDLWLSNLTDWGLHVTPNRECVSEAYTPERIQKEIAEFERKFAKQIAILKKHYGEENVAIEWGYFNYIH
jgi:hypothetical protein